MSEVKLEWIESADFHGIWLEMLDERNPRTIRVYDEGCYWRGEIQNHFMSRGKWECVAADADEAKAAVIAELLGRNESERIALESLK